MKPEAGWQSCEFPFSENNQNRPEIVSKQTKQGQKNKEEIMLRWLKNMFRRLLNIISNIICAISRWLSNIVHKKTEERKKEKQERRKHEKVVCSFPNLIYSLPLIIMGFVFWPIDAWGWANSEKLGWIWLITLLVTFLAMGLESFSWKMAGFWICVICACLWLRDVKHITIFDNVYNYLADLDIQYPRKAGLGFSISLGIPFIIMLMWAPVEYRWKVTNNYFEHLLFGSRHEMIAKGEQDFTYPNIFRIVLMLPFMMGNIEVTGSDRYARKIQNITFLPFRKKKILGILEATKVTSGEAGDTEAKQVVEVVVRGAGIQPVKEVSSDDAQPH